MTPKNRFLVLVSALLIGGFILINGIAYVISLNTLRKQIVTNDLPLTSDNIYSEIQKDLIKPIFISSLMAHDTFVQEWLQNGEKNEQQIRNYLKTIQIKYQAFTSFLVSEQSRIYYHSDGILKKVKLQEPRDTWYFRVRSMPQDYEINIDPDLANRDSMTIFINHRIVDSQGKYLGAIGIGMTIQALQTLIQEYQQRFQRDIYFVDYAGKLVLRAEGLFPGSDHLTNIPGTGSLSRDILASDHYRADILRNGKKIYLSTRYIQELKWILVAEQKEAGKKAYLNQILLVNILISLLITLSLVYLIHLSIKAYHNRLDEMAMNDRRAQLINQEQSDQIRKQNQDLLQANQQLEKALLDIDTLTGMLPVCSSCKKIRDDQGTWHSMEHYVQSHTRAQFTHGMCPDCMKKFYPDLTDRKDQK